MEIPTLVFIKMLSIAQRFRLPSICVLCNQFHHSKLAVCTGCIELLPELGLSCPVCAYPLFDTASILCGQCIKNRPDFDKVFVSYIFVEPLRSLIHQFKYHNALYLARFLSHLIENALENTLEKPECLIPIPMHKEKLKLRGFNHAVILTKILGKKLNIPIDLTSCQKITNTQAQAHLDSNQRKNNLKKAFTVRNLPYRHVALVDDLITTGATANELARTLKKTGIQKVDIWCCARTIPDKPISI